MGDLRALDAEIEHIVFGREVEQIGTRWFWVGLSLPGSPYQLPDGREAHPIRHYSEDVSSAMLVVRRLGELGYWCQMRTPLERDSEADYWAGFTPHSTTGWNGRPDHWTRAETLPLAICRAALLAAAPRGRATQVRVGHNGISLLSYTRRIFGLQHPCCVLNRGGGTGCGCCYQWRGGAELLSSRSRGVRVRCFC